MRNNNSLYISAHGQNPRGYGLWFLELDGVDGNGRSTTYTAAVKGWGKRTIQALEARGLVRNYDGEIRLTPEGEAKLFELRAARPRYEDHDGLRVRVGEFKNQSISGGPGMGDQDWLVNITISYNDRFICSGVVFGTEEWDPEATNRLGQKRAFRITPPPQHKIDEAKQRLIAYAKQKIEE